MIAENTVLGENVTVHHSDLVNLSDRQIGEGISFAALGEKGVRILCSLALGERPVLAAGARVPEGVPAKGFASRKADLRC